MKALLYVLPLLLFSPPLLAQDAPPPEVEGNLYYQAIVAGLEERKKYALKPYMNEPPGHIVVYKNPFLVDDGWPTRIGGVKVEYLTDDELRARLQARGGEDGIPVYVLNPMTNEGDRLVIRLLRADFHVYGGRGSFGIGGGYSIRFRYDCERQRFVAETATLPGI